MGCPSRPIRTDGTASTARGAVIGQADSCTLPPWAWCSAGSLPAARQQLGLHGGVIATEFPFEREEVEPEHVEGRHPGGEEAHQPEQRVAVEGLTENFVLAPETGQGGDAADGDAADEEGDGGDGHFLAQATHQTHVLGQHGLVAHHLFHGVDHGAGAQEQHRLEEGMGHQVEDAGDGGSTAHGQHHVTELGHGAVGQALLQIHLGEGDRCSQEAGDRSHHGDHGLHDRELGIEGIQTCDQEHPAATIVAA